MVQSKLKRNKAGFSLVELMVIVGIIALISTSVMISFRAPKAGTRLKATQSEVASAIKLAQSYALQGKIPAVGVRASQYGFEFTDNQHYRIFYTDSSGIQSLEEYSLADKNISLTSPALGETRFTFSVPDGTFGGSPAIFTFTHGDGSTRQIQILSGGAVVEN